MADHKHIIPFIKNAEGGLSKDKCDSASSFPVPDGSGYHTNKGITWKVFAMHFGVNEDSIARFYKMTDEDWGEIFKELYWDLILGDLIISQRIADLIVDWVWGSGAHYPELDVQIILNHAFGTNLAEDGKFGPHTIEAINSVDENTFWLDLVERRVQYFKDVVTAHAEDQKFLQGWFNRLNNLQKFEQINPN